MFPSAFAMSAHVAPWHDCHCAASDGVGWPPQAPSVAVSVWPAMGEPLTVGAAVFDGGAGASATSADGSEVAAPIRRRPSR